MEDDIRYVSLGEITKTYRQPDGSVIVEGRLGGETLDLDGQKLAKDWLDKEVPAWSKVGNVRAMHQAISAGKAISTEDRGQDWWLTAKIVDPIEAMKCEAGLYNGFSVGIKNGGWITTKDAPNGLINKGKIVEVSLADNPCDPANLGLSLVSKTAVAEVTEEDLEKLTDADIVKRDFTASDRKRMAGEGKALPDGSFPIANEEDLHNAVRLAGHAKDPAAAKRHIIQRARAMGLTDALPADWKADTKKMAFEEIVVEVASDPELLALLQKIVAPQLTKDATACKLPDACDCPECSDDPDAALPSKENADVDENTEPSTAAAPSPSPDGAVDANKSAEPDTTKAVTPDIDLTKYVTADDLKVTLADTIKAALSEAFKPLEDRIAEMEKRAAPGGPAVVRRQLDSTDNGKALLQKRAESLQAMLTHPDPRVAQDARYALDKLAQ